MTIGLPFKDKGVVYPLTQLNGLWKEPVEYKGSDPGDTSLECHPATRISARNYHTQTVRHP